jgi:hypothetical protein
VQDLAVLTTMATARGQTVAEWVTDHLSALAADYRAAERDAAARRR